MITFDITNNHLVTAYLGTHRLTAYGDCTKFKDHYQTNKINVSHNDFIKTLRSYDLRVI